MDGPQAPPATEPQGTIQRYNGQANGNSNGILYEYTPPGGNGPHLLFDLDPKNNFNIGKIFALLFGQNAPFLLGNLTGNTFQQEQANPQVPASSVTRAISDYNDHLRSTVANQASNPAADSTTTQTQRQPVHGQHQVFKNDSDGSRIDDTLQVNASGVPYRFIEKVISPENKVVSIVTANFNKDGSAAAITDIRTPAGQAPATSNDAALNAERETVATRLTNTLHNMGQAGLQDVTVYASNSAMQAARQANAPGVTTNSTTQPDTHLFAQNTHIHRTLNGAEIDDTLTVANGRALRLEETAKKNGTVVTSEADFNADGTITLKDVTTPHGSAPATSTDPGIQKFRTDVAHSMDDALGKMGINGVHVDPNIPQPNGRSRAPLNAAINGTNGPASNQNGANPAGLVNVSVNHGPWTGSAVITENGVTIDEKNSVDGTSRSIITNENSAQWQIKTGNTTLAVDNDAQGKPQFVTVNGHKVDLTKTPPDLSTRKYAEYVNEAWKETQDARDKAANPDANANGASNIHIKGEWHGNAKVDTDGSVKMTLLNNTDNSHPKYREIATDPQDSSQWSIKIREGANITTLSLKNDAQGNPTLTGISDTNGQPKQPTAQQTQQYASVITESKTDIDTARGTAENRREHPPRVYHAPVAHDSGWDRQENQERLAEADRSKPTENARKIDANGAGTISMKRGDYNYVYTFDGVQNGQNNFHETKTSLDGNTKIEASGFVARGGTVVQSITVKAPGGNLSGTFDPSSGRPAAGTDPSLNEYVNEVRRDMMSTNMVVFRPQQRQAAPGRP